MMKSKKGFSLIELLIVIAIIGVLAALAVPKYKEYTLRGKFLDVINSVNPIKLALSTCYTTNTSYMGCAEVVSYADTIDNVQIAFRPRVDSIKIETSNRDVVIITANASTGAFGFAAGTTGKYTYVLKGSAAADGSQFWFVDSSSTCLAAKNTGKITLCQVSN